MPYLTRTGRSEAARSTSHVPVADNVLIKEKLDSYRLYMPKAGGDIDHELILSAEALERVPGSVRWAMSFDGSQQEVAVREEYPSTRVGYIQVAGVLVHLEEMLKEGQHDLVDPSRVRDAISSSLYSLVLPGSNVCRRGMTSVQESWRAEVFEVFRDYRIEGTPLLDVFWLLAQRSDKWSSGGIVLAHCPRPDCTATGLGVLKNGSFCPSCRIALYPTDALRIHEEVDEESSNLTALGRLMMCLEHITVAAYISFLHQREAGLLSTVAFLVDGPLALFGPQAWLHGAIEKYLQELNLAVRPLGLPGILLFGIEKSGQFVEHLHGIGAALEPRHVMMLPDSYIFDHILTSRPLPGRTYGKDTYYGQKFFYKTAQGHLLVLTVPKETVNGPAAVRPESYPTLPTVLALLDEIGTALYQDAVIPVALAHSFASIPLRTGSKVLTLLARQHLLPAGD
jgi:hypothetical protein